MRGLLRWLTASRQTQTARTTKMSTMASGNADVPVGIRLIQTLGRSRFGAHLRINRQFAYVYTYAIEKCVQIFESHTYTSPPLPKNVYSYKSSVLVLTYLAYMCFHLTRKPIAVVKSVLHRNCSDLVMPNEYLSHLRDTQAPQLLDEETWCDYPPFGKHTDTFELSDDWLCLY